MKNNLYFLSIKVSPRIHDLGIQTVVTALFFMFFKSNLNVFPLRKLYHWRILLLTLVDVFSGWLRGDRFALIKQTDYWKVAENDSTGVGDSPYASVIPIMLFIFHACLRTWACCWHCCLGNKALGSTFAGEVNGKLNCLYMRMCLTGWQPVQDAASLSPSERWAGSSLPWPWTG